MKVIKIAQVPPPTVQADATIKQAIPNMRSECGCGVAVLDGESLVGSLSRDDVMLRVIGNGLNLEETKVREVMAPAATVTTDTDAREALKTMYESGKCFLGVVDEAGALQGWLAICNLFREREQDLAHQLDSLVAYMAADGPGG
jgi:CBS domain-containing protein